MLIDINRKLSDRQLRWFAGLWFPAFCGVIATVLFRRGADTFALALFVGAALLAIGGLVVPAVIRPVYIALTWITFPIGWVVSYVLLAAMYYGVLTPVGMLIRLFVDPMERRLDTSASSYWFPRESADSDRYFRQF